MRDLRRRRGIQLDVRAVVGVRLVYQVAHQHGDLLQREAIVRHQRIRVVRMRILDPRLQPLWLRFVANPRQLWTYIAADQVAGRVLYSMARGAERLSIETRSSRWIGGLSEWDNDCVGIARVRRAAAHQER